MPFTTIQAVLFSGNLAIAIVWPGAGTITCAVLTFILMVITFLQER